MRIVSGGQTGVDRAALDVALERGLPCGGWCPRGRRAEDGTIPARYPLRETPCADPSQRTDWNVRDADATLVLSRRRPSGGTALTLARARARGRPARLADPEDEAEVAAVRAWLRELAPPTLNVAGPRESQDPGIHAAARRFLVALLD